MLVFRWQAPLLPNCSQIMSMFESEGLEPFEETYLPETVVSDHRHPFDEIRTVVEGEVMFDVSGNKLLLRSGDRIVIPSNTKHSFKVNAGNKLICVCANRIS